MTRIKDAVRFLVGMELIKQDGRSVRAGHGTTDPDVMYYTNAKKREIVELVALGVV